jgi:hypothetical protein
MDRAPEVFRWMARDLVFLQGYWRATREAFIDRKLDRPRPGLRAGRGRRDRGLRDVGEALQGRPPHVRPANALALGADGRAGRGRKPRRHTIPAGAREHDRLRGLQSDLPARQGAFAGDRASARLWPEPLRRIRRTGQPCPSCSGGSSTGAAAQGPRGWDHRRRQREGVSLAVSGVEAIAELNDFVRAGPRASGISAARSSRWFCSMLDR